MAHQVEFLWFQGCPNHEGGPRDPRRGHRHRRHRPRGGETHRFPGSPTIRVDGKDVDPAFVDRGDYTPRCRLFRSDSGIVGVPERRWIEDALR